MLALQKVHHFRFAVHLVQSVPFEVHLSPRGEMLLSKILLAHKREDVRRLPQIQLVHQYAANAVNREEIAWNVEHLPGVLEHVEYLLGQFYLPKVLFSRLQL